jgi:hypothetical protein
MRTNMSVRHKDGHGSLATLPSKRPSAGHISTGNNDVIATFVEIDVDQHSYLLTLREGRTPSTIAVAGHADQRRPEELRPDDDSP